MEFKSVKAVDSVEEKSIQEKEQEIIDKHEEQEKEVQEHSEEGGEGIQDSKEEEQELKKPSFRDEDVLSYIKDKLGREVNSFDDLVERVEVEKDIEDDVVKGFMQFRKDTGGSLADYYEINIGYSDMSDDQLLSKYHKYQEPDLDTDDIRYLMEKKYSYDEDMMDEDEVRSMKLAKKRDLSKAKKFFDERKEKYKASIESKGSQISDEDLNILKSYKEQSKLQEEYEAESLKRAKYFEQKTREVFSDDFKGFDFTIGDQKLQFSPGDAKQIMSDQSDFSNFINKYLDQETGLITDASGYHKALAMALNPDAAAEFFYEKGKADAIESDARRSKNLNLDARKSPQQSGKPTGFQVRAVNPESGRGLKIKSKN